MGIRETLRLAGEDPLYLIRAAKRGQLEALRAALAARMPACTDVNQVAFDDAAEPDFAPRDQASICRRLYHNRLGLNLSARIESRSKWRLLATAVAGLAGTIAIASIGGEGRTELQIAVERAISAGAGLLAIGGGGWLAWLALGLSPRAHAMTMPESVLNEADLEDANAFARRALIRELPDGVPADLADTYRPLTIDAEGRAVEGQVIAQDLVESYAVEAASGRQLILGIASLGVLLAGFGALSDSALLSGLASGVAITSAVIAALRLFVLPDVAERRAIAGHEAREASPLAKLVQETGEAQGKQIEAARAQQLANALADPSAFIPLGVSTGLFAERRDPFAPSAAGMPFGLTAADLSTHALVFGDTGSGKTSGVLRPVIAAQLVSTPIVSGIEKARAEAAREAAATAAQEQQAKRAAAAAERARADLERRAGQNAQRVSASRAKVWRDIESVRALAKDQSKSEIVRESARLALEARPAPADLPSSAAIDLATAIQADAETFATRGEAPAVNKAITAYQDGTNRVGEYLNQLEDERRRQFNELRRRPQAPQAKAQAPASVTPTIPAARMPALRPQNEPAQAAKRQVTDW